MNSVADKKNTRFIFRHSEDGTIAPYGAVYDPYDYVNLSHSDWKMISYPNNDEWDLPVYSEKYDLFMIKRIYGTLPNSDYIYIKDGMTEIAVTRDIWNPAWSVTSVSKLDDVDTLLRTLDYRNTIHSTAPDINDKIICMSTENPTRQMISIDGGVSWTLLNLPKYGNETWSLVKYNHTHGAFVTTNVITNIQHVAGSPKVLERALMRIAYTFSIEEQNWIVAYCQVGENIDDVIIGSTATQENKTMDDIIIPDVSLAMQMINDADWISKVTTEEESNKMNKNHSTEIIYKHIELENPTNIYGAYVNAVATKKDYFRGYNAPIQPNEEAHELPYTIRYSQWNGDRWKKYTHPVTVSHITERADGKIIVADVLGDVWFGEPNSMVKIISKPAINCRNISIGRIDDNLHSINTYRVDNYIGIIHGDDVYHNHIGNSNTEWGIPMMIDNLLVMYSFNDGLFATSVDYGKTWKVACAIDQVGRRPFMMGNVIMINSSSGMKVISANNEGTGIDIHDVVFKPDFTAFYIAMVNDIYFAINRSGYIAVSSDLFNWTYINIEKDETFEFIYNDNTGYYIAYGSKGTKCSTKDPFVSWNICDDDAIELNFETLSKFNTGYIAEDDDGVIHYSDTGIIWTPTRLTSEEIYINNGRSIAWRYSPKKHILSYTLDLENWHDYEFEGIDDTAMILIKVLRSGEDNNYPSGIFWNGRRFRRTPDGDVYDNVVDITFKITI